MSTAEQNYFIPEPSRWPAVAVVGLFFLVLGFALWMNGVSAGPVSTGIGLLVIIYLFFGWFGDVIDESLTNKYNQDVDRSFRQGMFWFITSEVSFFATFFGCLYYFRNISLPWLGGEGQLGVSNILWEGFTYTWPLVNLPDVTNYTQLIEPMGAGGIPAYNTIILLSSGVTVTWAHWGLKKDNRAQLVWGLIATIALGMIFFALQAYEYYHAYTELGLTLNSGIYGSTFYMLTGFHGFHVTLGTIMLMVICARSMKGHFTEENHFAFEGVAWYWHFVDVVWLGLYLFVYWL
ncbi:MAG: cytochrome c oxidase subunit 3 [Gammaproteobacteria bacterium]|nr:cytochrome c oxidase subunit 3 [Gammaproteobacteria bacterium]MCW8911279.1 cytochrome c oxidase subunit 3 [Gammaproteobacteria bacterium]MCW9055494.1 cytochrome c oxidase subunit 3 [Gammaproteobacteria bacterium]